MDIGFIGLGRMGSPMATNLLRAGHRVRVFNRTSSRAEQLARAGATVASSVTEACSSAELVVTMLADDDALVEVVTGFQGILTSLGQDGVHLAMGTHGVSTINSLARRHQELGQHLVAAPVVGRPLAASEGQLTIVVAGDSDAVARCRPVLDVLGRRSHLVGEIPAAACATKLVNNFVLATVIEVLGEAMSLARAYEVAPASLLEILLDGIFGCPAFRTYGQIILEERYDDVGITTRLGLKDLELLLQAGRLGEVPLPLASVVRDRQLGAIAHGDGDLDWSVVAREQQRASAMAIGAVRESLRPGDAMPSARRSVADREAAEPGP